MNQEFKKEWVAALRSGNYQQGVGFLASHDKYCCLGVACDLLVKQQKLTSTSSGTGLTLFGLGKSNALLPRLAVEIMGVVRSAPTVFVPDNTEGVADKYYTKDVELSTLNDEGVKFSVIADLIEQGL